MKTPIYFLLLSMGQASLCIAQEERQIVPHANWYRYHTDNALRAMVPKSGLITDSDSWEKLWKAWYTEDLPDVDFAKEMILVDTVSGHNLISLLPMVREDQLRVVTVATIVDTRQGFSSQIAKVKRTGIKWVDGNSLEKPLKPEGVRISIKLLSAELKDQMLAAKLMEYDLKSPDGPAKIVDETRLNWFGFVPDRGEASNEARFALGSLIIPRDDRGYYVTVDVFKDGKRTHVGESTDNRTRCRVLTQGYPAFVKFVLKRVP